MADLFDLFGAQARPQQRATANWPLRGRDLTASLQLDFESAVNGLTTTLQLDGRTVNTRIPAGVKDGQTIRLVGKGTPGANGGPSGDLLIEIAVDKHPVFERSGRDLTVTVPISYADAVLGGEMRVPTLDGHLCHHQGPLWYAGWKDLPRVGPGCTPSHETWELTGHGHHRCADFSHRRECRTAPAVVGLAPRATALDSVVSTR